MEYKEGEPETFTYHHTINKDTSAHFTIGPKGEIQKVNITPTTPKPVKEPLMLAWNSITPRKLKMLVDHKWVFLSFDTIEECVAVIVILHNTYEVNVQ